MLLKAAMRYRTKSNTRRISRPAATIVKNALKTTVAGTFAGKPKSTGNLARSIKIFTMPSSYNVFVGAHVGGTGTTKSRYTDGYYFGWHDQGAFRTGKRSGKRYRSVRPKYMLDRAFAKSANAASQALTAALYEDLKYLI